MNIEHIITQIQKSGYISLPSPITEAEGERCVALFRECIVSVPLAYLVATDFRYDPTQRLSLGFRDKSQSEGFDEKYYFHYHRTLIENLAPDAPQAYRAFLEYIHTLYEKVDATVHEIFDALIGARYIERESCYAPDGSTNINIRILQYRPKPECRFLAKPHTDRGIWTFALYETDAGLRLYTPEKAIVPLSYEDGVLRMFPADLARALISAPLGSTIHDVIKEGNHIERASIVVFVNPAFGKGPYKEGDTDDGYN